MRRPADDLSSLQAFLTITNGKWKLLYHLLQQPMRANELTRRLPRVTKRMFARKVRELETEGLIERRVLPGSPAEIEFRVTRKGKSLRRVMDATFQWGLKYQIEAAMVAKPDAPVKPSKRVLAKPARS
jgi:DNA-binding HxlR family transcriptional regulator